MRENLTVGNVVFGPESTAGGGAEKASVSSKPGTGPKPDLPTHHEFFGDAEHDFALSPDLIQELERTTGAGIGGLSRRLFAGDFSHADMLAVIRLSLIGGGVLPKDAAALVGTYAARRPIMEAYPLAVSILETVMFGKANAPEVPDE